MKKFGRLLIIETQTANEQLADFQPLFESFFPGAVYRTKLQAVLLNNSVPLPDLIFFCSQLTKIDHLQQFIELQSRFPHATLVIVAERQDEELCMLAIEAGAEDVIAEERLSRPYVYRLSAIAQRRSQIERELLQSKSQLMACIQNTPNVAVQWYDSKGRVIFWNKASERVFGWTAEEVKGKTVGQLILTPEEEKQFLTSLNQLEQNGQSSETCEYVFQRRDGSKGCCLSTMFRIDGGETEPWFVCMDVDITDRKHTEEALVQSKEMYRQLVEQQADAITLFNERGQILDVNSSATELLLYSRGEFQQLTLLHILPPEDVQHNPISFELLKQGQTTIKQRKMRRKDGTYVETEVHTKWLGENMFLASVRDLNERIEVQHRLQKEIALSDSIINSLPHLFYLFTKEGKYIRWNRHLQTVSGYSAEEISEISPLQFFTETEKPLIVDAIEKVYENGSYAVEANLFTKDGNLIPHYFTGVTVDYAGTQCLLGVGIDLSNVKTLEKKLSQQKIAQQKKLMQAMIHAEEKEKNKLGLELHDNVNQILSVVKMYLNILDSEDQMQEVTLPKTIKLLNTAIDEIRHLSHSLAVSYKFEAGLVEAMEEMVEKISLARDFSIQLHMCNCLDDSTNDQQKLAIYRIVQEQLNNIIKYARATKVEIDITTDEGKILLCIRDNGQGFNPALVNKGLGLSNIINRAEALEGKASIQSAPGKGCCLLVTIPLNVEAAVEES